jgi:hypothetical protein
VLIARTESTRASMEGLRISSQASGVVKGFKWLTSSDPCPLCQDKNGEFIPLNGDMPPLHPNCVCTVEEELDFDLL